MKHVLLFVSALLVACSAADSKGLGPDEWPFNVEVVAQIDEPWAMTFLPNGNLLITRKPGEMLIVSPTGDTLGRVNGVPDVDYGGQGGLGDVILSPDYARSKRIYFSYAEAGDSDTRGAAVATALLSADDADAELIDVQVIWRQVPKVSGRGHYGHRLVFSDDAYLFISSGERQKFDPSQDMQSNLGKIIRLHPDGEVPTDNPYYERGGVTAEIWSLGHRNPLGIAFDTQGRLWNHEMGPRHGDELNLVQPTKNYGYPLVSNGDHYSGKEIPDHDTRPDLEAPKAYWVPAISPAGFIIYDGEMFEDFYGNGFIGGLSSESLVRVRLGEDSAEEIERYSMGKRIREIEQGPDGSIWVLEDKSGARLLKLTPKS
ncbi:MAG: PQQ-dependent sugar dehydrogenase [Pseudomonadota bacterium]